MLNVSSSFRMTTFNEEDNKEFLEILKNYEMCLKAINQRKKHREQHKKSTLQEQIKNNKKVKLLDGIIRTTKAKLREQLRSFERTEKYAESDQQIRVTFNEIQQFLRVSNTTDVIVDQEDDYQINQPQEYATSRILEAARGKIYSYHDKRYRQLNEELSGCFTDRSAYLDSEGNLNKQAQYFSKLEKQINSDQKLAQRQRKLNQIQSSTPDVVSQYKVPQVVRSDIQEDAKAYYYQKSSHAKDTAQKASIHLFRKKFGNNMVRLKKLKEDQFSNYLNSEQEKLRYSVMSKLDNLSTKATSPTDQSQSKVLNRKLIPPTELTQLKTLSNQFLRNVDGHLIKFKHEKEDLKTELKLYQKDMKQGMDTIHDRFLFLKRITN